jgi:nitric oxide reductase subunit B
MLVYGTAIFVMEKISGDEKTGKSKLAFLMYFLGLTNLMFGWAHHIYNVPTAKWIRYLAYFISMTELIILAKIIISWRNSMGEHLRAQFTIARAFIIASDVWIFINLALALAISVPAINLFTHGTHITVAHAMGSTIGINTMILLASCFYIAVHASSKPFTAFQQKIIMCGFWITNISLLIFWLCLLIAGILKGKGILIDKLSFSAAMQNIHAYLITFAFAGIGIFAGLILVLLPLLKKLAQTEEAK